MLEIRFPLIIEIGSSTAEGVNVTAIIMIPYLDSKVLVTFAFSGDCIARWPLTIADVRYTAKVAYGRAQYVVSFHFCDKADGFAIGSKISSKC